MKGTHVKPRAAKRARFAAKASQRKKAPRSTIVFILGAAVLIVGGIALFLLRRPSSSGAATPVLGPAQWSPLKATCPILR